MRILPFNFTIHQSESHQKEALLLEGGTDLGLDWRLESPPPTSPADLLNVS